PSAIAIANVVVESIPPLRRTTARFIYQTTTSSGAKSKDPVEQPLGLAPGFLDFARNDRWIIDARVACPCPDTAHAQSARCRRARRIARSRSLRVARRP